MSLTKSQIAAEVAAIVQQVTLTTADKAQAQAEGKSAIDGVRKLAAEVAADLPGEAKKVAAYIHAELIAAKVPKGSADPYKAAFTGYVTAVTEGVDITTGAGVKGDEPMPATAAREFNRPKAERDERAAIRELKSEISRAVGRAPTVAMLKDILELVNDLVPAAKSTETATVTDVDPASILDSIAA